MDLGEQFQCTVMPIRRVGKKFRNQAGNFGAFDLIQHLLVAYKRHGKQISSVAYTITTINRHRKSNILGMALSDESALRSSHNT